MVQEQIIAIFTIMIEILHKYPLKDLNSFGLDTRASFYASPDNLKALCKILKDPAYSKMPLLVLGEGSNILFRQDFAGLVIHPDMKGIEVVEEKEDELVVKVGASENWDSWVAYATEKGWYGLENLSLIPGSVG